jgi:hypothetical protein
MFKPVRFLQDMAPASMLIGTLIAAACSDSTSPPLSYSWAGTYAAQTRFGGCQGTWGNGTQGSHLLVIATGREVFRNGAQIVNPTVGDSTISWSMSDGNGSSANITFHGASTDACFWGVNGQTGPLFEGTIQFPGEGPLDYRGVKQ